MPLCLALTRAGLRVRSNGHPFGGMAACAACQPGSGATPGVPTSALTGLRPDLLRHSS